MSLLAMQEACHAEVERAFLVAEKHYGRKLQRVPVDFSSTMTSTGGFARYRAYHRGTAQERHEVRDIRLSLPLLKAQPETFVKEVCGHEAAHIIDILVNGLSSGHGQNWIDIMAIIGCNASRLHSMNLAPEGKARRTIVFCKCQAHYIGPKRAKGLTHLTCRKCKSNLNLTPFTDAQQAELDEHKHLQQQVEDAKPAVNVQVGGGRRGTKAEEVRNIIKANPQADYAMLCQLVTPENTGVKKNLIAKYVKENMVRVRG